MTQKIDVEFKINLDKNIYENSPWNTPENLFNSLVLKQIANDYGFLSKSIKEQKSIEEQKEYEGFLLTLKDLKESIEKSIKYEVMDSSDNIEQIKVTFNFKYYENTKDSPGEIVLLDIFNKSIRSNYFLAKDLPRIARDAPKDAKEKVDSTIKLFNHIGEFLTEAKNSLIIYADGVKQEIELEPTLNSPPKLKN